MWKFEIFVGENQIFDNFGISIFAKDPRISRELSGVGL